MTAIDFTAEVEKRKEDLLVDLFSLLEINSERDDSKADARASIWTWSSKSLGEIP